MEPSNKCKKALHQEFTQNTEKPYHKSKKGALSRNLIKNLSN